MARVAIEGSTAGRAFRVGSGDLVWIALGIPLAIAAAYVVSWLDPGPPTLLIGGTAIVTLLPVVIRVVQGRFDPFEPIFVFALAYGVMFVLRPAAELSRGTYVFAISGQGISFNATFVEALVLGFVGACGFVSGYSLTLGADLARRLRPVATEYSPRRVAHVVTALGLGGLVLFCLFLLRQGGLPAFALLLSGRSETLTEAVSTSSKYFWLAPFLLIPTSLVLFALGTRHRRSGWLIVAGLALVALLLTKGPVGSRMALLPLVGGLVIYIYIRNQRRPSFTAVVAALAGALLFSSFVLSVRTTTSREAQTLSGAVIQAISTPAQALEPLVSGQDSAEAPGLASALTVVPSDVSHTYGTAVLGDLFIRPIPRSIWPTKPKPPREAVIAALWPQQYRVGTANPEFSALFAWFLDGGIAGVFLGMLLYGIALRALYAYFLRFRRNLPAQLLFATSVPMTVILLRDSPTDTIARAMFVVFPIWLAFRMARDRSGRPS